jgi:hypothetical protein
MSGLADGLEQVNAAASAASIQNQLSPIAGFNDGGVI